jgi:16S rRNA (adenine1518-N6/adenine1519-N6)-dimethyltransferase
LINKSVLRKIIAAADLSKDDIVLEVGPGLGILTLELAKYVKKVIAVEKDKKMVEVIKNVLNDENVKNVEVIEGDILKIQKAITALCHPEPEAKDLTPEEAHADEILLRQLTDQNDIKYKLVANIPYYLTSTLIRKFLESNFPPQAMVLMIQKEVAQRICAQPPKMTLLATAVQFYAEPKIISYVSKKSFVPQPKVDSAIIKIVPRAIGTKSLQRDLVPEFFKIAKAGFAHPRKQLINNLSAGLKLSREKTEKIILKTGLQPTARPSELSVDNWLDLAWNIWGKKDII